MILTKHQRQALRAALRRTGLQVEAPDRWHYPDEVFALVVTRNDRDRDRLQDLMDNQEVVNPGAVLFLKDAPEWNTPTRTALTLTGGPESAVSSYPVVCARPERN